MSTAERLAHLRASIAGHYVAMAQVQTDYARELARWSTS